MNDDFDDTHSSTPAKVAVAVIAALLTASVGQGFLVWRDVAVLSHTVAELRDTYVTDAATLAAIAQQAHANSIHRVEHERQAKRYIDKIEANERSIIELRVNTQSRADPFTGTEGAELRTRIQRLEQSQPDQ
jgi:hypothetical protein